MVEIKNWFEEVKNKSHNCGDYEFVIRKGFKITHYFAEDEYTIQDTRYYDFYTSVSEADMKIIQENGFVRGTNIIMYKRNVYRVEKYLQRIGRALVMRKKDIADRHLDKPFYDNRIKNCTKSLKEDNTTMQFYRLQVEQFEKLNTEKLN